MSWTRLGKFRRLAVDINDPRLQEFARLYRKAEVDITIKFTADKRGARERALCEAVRLFNAGFGWIRVDVHTRGKKRNVIVINLKGSSENFAALHQDLRQAITAIAEVIP